MNAKPFLMFKRDAEKAMRLYCETFPGARIVSLNTYADGEIGPAGSLKTGSFEVAGLTVMCSDSPVEHAFDFTPSSSLFVNCDGIGELDRIYERLADGGLVRMPVGAYGFSQRFAWVTDRFGVSWQLNVP